MHLLRAFSGVSCLRVLVVYFKFIAFKTVSLLYSEKLSRLIL